MVPWVPTRRHLGLNTENLGQRLHGVVHGVVNGMAHLAQTGQKKKKKRM